MKSPRPGWWRPLARRRWDREEAARVRLRELLRASPQLRAIAESMARAQEAFGRVGQELAETLRRSQERRSRGSNGK